MDSRELAEWMAYYRIEPFGENRADYRAGVISSVLANINKKKGSKAFKPEDFVPQFDGKYIIKFLPSAKELSAKIKMIFGSRKRKKKKGRKKGRKT